MASCLGIMNEAKLHGIDLVIQERCLCNTISMRVLIREYTAKSIKVFPRQSQKAKAKRGKYDGNYYI